MLFEFGSLEDNQLLELHLRKVKELLKLLSFIRDEDRRGPVLSSRSARLRSVGVSAHLSGFYFDFVVSYVIARVYFALCLFWFAVFLPLDFSSDGQSSRLGRGSAHLKTFRRSLVSRVRS